MCNLAKKPRTIECAGVHGLCSGSARALSMVSAALATSDTPLYCLHELLHNRSISHKLSEQGLISVRHLEEIPQGATVIISAHGAPPKLFEDATRMGIGVLDATCPLVKRLHQCACRADLDQLILVGHDGHPEVVGTLGYAQKAVMVGSLDEVENLPDFGLAKIILIAQTTIEKSKLDDIKIAMKHKYGERLIDRAEVCPATSRRQQSLLELAGRCELLLVVGSPHSSNSRRLVECGKRTGTRAILVDGVDCLTREMVEGVNSVGLSAGASVGEAEFKEVLSLLKSKFGFVQIGDGKKMTEDAIL